MKPILTIMILLVCIAPAAAQDAPSDDTDPIQAQTAMSVEPAPSPEKFVAPVADLTNFQGGTIILRPDATVTDEKIRIRNVCRWESTDNAIFQPVADLGVGHFAGSDLYATVTLQDLQTTLRDAGVNLAMVNFGGATSCAVNRPDVPTQKRMTLSNWIDANHAQLATAVEAPLAAPAPVIAQPSPASPPSGPVQSLRDLLTADLCSRLQVDADKLEIAFNPGDEKVLKLSQPVFQFDITPRTGRGLGAVSWDVTITAGGQHQTTVIAATARLWETQTILQKPLSYRQPIRDQDVIEKRILTDQTSDDPPLTKEQAVGQDASRDLKPGTVLTASMVDPVLLAQQGQLITVNVVRGTIKITAVARALENGSYGQTIRARNDVDPTQTFQVLLTGPQEGTVTATPVAASSDASSAGIAAVAN